MFGKEKNGFLLYFEFSFQAVHKSFVGHNNNMSYHSGPGPLPNRWLHCPRNGESFIADKFLPFKTPLNARFASQMPANCQFEPDMVFSFVKMFKVSLSPCEIQLANEFTTTVTR